jgi:hypothetical protein
MGETLDGKRACEKYTKRIMNFRSEVSDVLKRELRLEMDVGDDGVINTKLFDMKLEVESIREVFRITLDANKAVCKVDVEWASIPEVTNYEKAAVFQTFKYKLSEKPVFKKLLYRKEKELVNKILNAVNKTISADIN